MGRKKKTEITESGTSEPVLSHEAKRGIWAVVLFALAALFFLGLIGQAGSFGELIDKLLGLGVGWSRWLLPPLLVLVGTMLFRRRTTSFRDVVKYVALTVSFVALLGLTHLFLGETSKELKRAAIEGIGGGYIGYFLVVGLVGAMGKVATMVVLLTLFVTGIIAAFNVSLHFFLERWQARFVQKTDEQENAGEAPTQVALSTGEEKEEQTSSDPLSLAEAFPETAHSAVAEGTATEGGESTENNIQNMRFVGQEETTEEEERSEPAASLEDDTVLVPAFIRPKKPKLKSRWELPPMELLATSQDQGQGGDIEQNRDIIMRTLNHFGIEVEPGEVLQGPTVTQYTFRPAVGVRLSRITTLNDNLALALAAHQVRIEAPIPGKSLIGIEVPNKTKAMVRLRNFLEARDFRSRASNLTLVLGQDVSGRMVYADLAKMPHVLIAGATNSGKSVCVNTFILSLLYQNSPDELKLILVDPKRVELSLYRNIPHLRTDVIVDSPKVVNALRWAIGEMERRYKVLEEAGSRDLFSYREKMLRGEKKRAFDAETNATTEEYLEPLSQIVIVIDEMADLMMAHGKEVESLIVRLAQKARAVGIHLVLATQRPEVNVITGLIKANIPARISFQLKTQIDSRTIFGTGGAEKLLGQGDMLYSSAEASSLQRIQGVYVSEDEVKKVVHYLINQKIQKGWDEIGEDLGADGKRETVEMGALPLNLDTPLEADDDESIYNAAKALVIRTQKVSTTYLQRHLKIGYPKAARITDMLEERGVISFEENKRRTVLIPREGDETAPQYGEDPMTDQAMRDKWQA
ncbi:MAG: DNA translocase FtsK [Candidatus Moraniibacteriota bacterium]|nr:MAG: DNA translocase FtsK [Candidatus Moranbacteria bacterium]